ncbi:hypothetical protein [Neisseria sp. Ec49-e6-T10]|uniref:hypothetical protein n=1 Tax=Neisseria sp. Ec49-e6-T10 TaxID=3140744 RepID=UPI003EC03CE5
MNDKRLYQDINTENNYPHLYSEIIESTYNCHLLLEENNCLLIDEMVKLCQLLEQANCNLRGSQTSYRFSVENHQLILEGKIPVSKELFLFLFKQLKHSPIQDTPTIPQTHPHCYTHIKPFDCIEEPDDQDDD